MIPRIVHRIWLGGEMPDEFKRYGDTWKDHHPDWDHKLWDDNNSLAFQDECYSRATSQAQKADILRYRIIHAIGGVYIDTDFECLQPITQLISKEKAFSASEAEGVVSIGIFGATEHHPFIEQCVKSIPQRMQEFSEVHKATGPHLMTKVYDNLTPKEKEGITVFPAEQFYPYGHGQMWRKGEEFPEAYAVHHWAGSWR